MSERIYGDLASWFHLITHPKDYEEEAQYYGDELVRLCNAKTLLELGSGGGNNASWMKKRFDLVLTDLSPQMLALSRTLNPELEHVQGDMRTLRLGRVFDGVFMHDAVAYLQTEDDLRGAFQTAWAHLKPGGGVLIAPDDVRDTFKPSSQMGGHDGDGRSLRYLSWDRGADPHGTICYTDFVYMLREGDQPPRIETDIHTLGLFPVATWVGLLEETGFRTEVGATPDWDEEHPSQAIFFGVRPPD